MVLLCYKILNKAGQYLLKACLALLDTPFFYFFTRNADRR